VCPVLKIRRKRRQAIVLRSQPNSVGTAQACLFRDSYQELISLGFAIYGLSRDTPKANAQFKVKNELPFALICNTDGSLIDALGFKKPPKGTARGVVVIDKDGRILASMIGTPDATVQAVHGICERSSEPSTPSVMMRQSFLGANDIASAIQNAGRADMEHVAQTVTTVAGRVNVAAETFDARAGHDV
jgi:peroxiredoxin